MKNLTFLACFLVLTCNVYAQIISSDEIKSLDFRFIGPEGNRAIAIAGVPGDPTTAYIGAASGGLWKTTDSGLNWRPVTDSLDVSSVGSIALASSDPNQIWMGTGETFVIRPAHAMGDGIYFSADAGKSWTRKGLEKTGRIGRVLIHPENPKIIYAAALGHTYGPQEDRGVYKTVDGGETWERVLFIDKGTGAADMAMDPENPDILWAAMWSIHINTWGLNSGGPGGGIYRSTDAGKTWEPMTEYGLPGGIENPVGKTAVAVAPGDGNIVYALFEMESPSLYRSADKGKSWELMTRNHDIAERAPYYTRMAVAPDNPDEVFFMSVKFSRSIDGGKTLEESGYRAGGDNHDIWIDPKIPDRYMVAHDGCASITVNDGRSYQRVVLPIAQMYHVSTDDNIPYNVYGNRQDGYSYMGPSNSLQGYIPLGLWHDVGGCESGFAKADPFDNNIVWSGCYDGGLERFDMRTGHARDVRVWPEAGYGWAPKDLKYRWHWNFPLSFSPHVPHRVYVGSQFVHQSDDGGNSWQVISPDLTLNLKSHQQSSGGVAVDNLMTFDGAVLFAIEESKLESGLIWVGSNDGQVHITKNGGENWENVTANIPDLPQWGTIANIEPSDFDKGTAYITVDLHQMGDFGTYIFKTTDYGQTWKNIKGNIPQSVHSFAHCITEDPKERGVLYLGVDNGIYFSVDDGNYWNRLRNNLPPAPVYWLEVQERFDDLVVGTYGRGYYILDNIGTIREYAKRAKSQDAHLFPMRKAYRFNDKYAIKTDGPSLNSGQNPRYGADINFYLKDTAQSNLVLQIENEGEVIRTLQVKNQAGLQRTYWDLRYEPTYRPRLKSTPPGRPWVQLRGEGWRPLVTWDLDLWRGQFGPRVVPGKYTVKLIVDDKEYLQELEIAKDPKSAGTITEIQQQVSFSLELREAINVAVMAINEVEDIRAELVKLIPELKRNRDRKAAQLLLEKAESIAGTLYDIHLTGAREDAFRSPMKLYGRLSALASDITGNGVDFGPTQQQGEVKEILSKRLKAAEERLENLVENDIKEFNKRLNSQNLKIDIEGGGE